MKETPLDYLLAARQKLGSVTKAKGDAKSIIEAVQFLGQAVELLIQQEEEREPPSL